MPKEIERELETISMLPCPFCGRQPKLSWRYAGAGSSYAETTGKVFIASCMCGGYSACAHKFSDSIESLAKAWNTRSG